MGCFLVLVYALRKTYKTASAIQRRYKDVRFFKAAASASDQRSREKKGGAGSEASQEPMRKTALELLQILRSKNGHSVFVTSATPNEGKTEVTFSLARELAGFGKSVLILETDSENTDMSKHLGVSDILPGYTLSALLQDGAALESVAAAIQDQSIKVIFANNYVQDDFGPYTAEDVRNKLEQAAKLMDVILIDGCIWTRSGDDRIWREAADASLAVCRQDKADFFAIDRMMTDLRENDPGFLGCVLYGF